MTRFIRSGWCARREPSSGSRGGQHRPVARASGPRLDHWTRSRGLRRGRRGRSQHADRNYAHVHDRDHDDDGHDDRACAASSSGRDRGRVLLQRHSVGLDRPRHRARPRPADRVGRMAPAPVECSRLGRRDRGPQPPSRGRSRGAHQTTPRRPPPGTCARGSTSSRRHSRPTGRCGSARRRRAPSSSPTRPRSSASRPSSCKVHSARPVPSL